jgi:hypothetical protein
LNELTWLTASAAIAIGHLGVKLALFIGSLTSAGEIRAWLRVAAGMVLRATLATTATAATTATTSAPGTTITTRTILRLTVGGIDVRWRFGRPCRGIVARCGHWSSAGVCIRGSLLLALAFALPLTLCLSLGFALWVALWVALARRLVTLCLARRLSCYVTRGLRRVTIARRRRGITVAAMLAMAVPSAVLVTIVAVTPMRTAVTTTITITATTTVPGAITVTTTTMPGAAAVTITIAVAMSITTRLAACRGRLSGSCAARGLAGE